MAANENVLPLLPPSPIKPRHACITAACGCGWRELQVLLLLAVPTIITTAAQQIVIVLSQVSDKPQLW